MNQLKEFYLYNELEAIGFIGDYSLRDIPFVIEPVYKVKEKKIVLIGPFEEENQSESVKVGEWRTSEEFENLINEGDATRMQPVQAVKEYCIYRNPNPVKLEYISFKQAYDRLVSFSNYYRELGDRDFKERKFKEARENYIICASVSQNAEDYARILLLDNSQGEKEFLEDMIKGLEENPKLVLDSLKRRLF